MQMHKMSMIDKVLLISSLIVLMLVICSISLASGVPAICTGSNVNYRTEADGNSKIIGKLQAGDKVNIMAVIGDWYKIIMNNGFAYVNKRFLDPTYNAYVSSNNVNVRALPNLGSEIVGAVGTNNKISVILQNGDWYKIKYEEVEGWAFSEYIAIISRDFNIEEGAAVTVAQIQEKKQGTINATNVNFRRGSSKDAAIITRLPINAPVSVLSKDGDWYNVEYNGTNGYIVSGFVNVLEIPTATVENYDATKEFVYVISEAGVNLRKFPAVNADKKLSIAFGEKLKVVKSVNSEWIEVETSSGENGYVFQEYVGNETTKKTSNVAPTNQVEISSNSDKASEIVAYAKKFIGTPYAWGGNSLTSGIDCSGFTQQVMSKFSISIPRTSRDQATIGTFVNKNQLQPGDLVFFDSLKKGYVSHAGMYIGNGSFIHASSSSKHNGITITSLSDYNHVYITARRVIK